MREYYETPEEHAERRDCMETAAADRIAKEKAVARQARLEEGPTDMEPRENFASIPEMLGHLQEQINRGHSAVSSLEVRIEPILVEFRPDDADMAMAAPGGKSPVAKNVDECLQALNHLIQRIDRLTAHAQL